MPDDVAESGLSDLRNSVSEAWAKLDPTPESTPEAPAVPAAASVEPAAPEAPAKAEASPDGPARGPDGKFTKKEAGEASKGTPAPRTSDSGAQDEVVSGKPGSLPPAVAPTAPPAPVSFKAPQSWKPAVRDLAARLPAEFHPILEESARREAEISRAMQEAAERTKGAGEWSEVVRPYEAQIRQLGVQPSAYVGDLLKTAHALTYSHPAQKADVLAGLIMQFGVPPGDLDNALVARMQGQPAQAKAPEYRDPRVDQLLQQMQSQKDAEARARTARFAESHEHFNDVADEMLAIVEGWKKLGRPYDTDDAMEKAYRMACNGNDTIQAATRQREAAVAAEKANASTQRAKAASVSVKSQPGGPVAKAAPGDDIRSHVEAAWDRAAQ